MCALSLLMQLKALVLELREQVSNNVVSRVFTDGRQGECQRLDRHASGLILITHTTRTHTLLSSKHYTAKYHLLACVREWKRQQDF